MSGLMMMAKVAQVQLSEKPDGWDVLVFEVEKMDDKLKKVVSVAQTALVPTSAKTHVRSFRENEGQMVLVPVEMRTGKTGAGYLIVTGGIIDATELLTVDSK